VTTVTVQDPSILWGDLQLHGPLETDATYEIVTMSDSTNFGNPVSIIEQVQSMAIDGALAARTGWDARTIVVRLRIAANDGETLAQVEQMLTAQVLLDRPPPLEWTPPAGSSAPAVFDVLVADLQRDVDAGWDYSELFSGHRFFVLTLTCLPFARAMDTVVVPALAPPPTPGSSSTTLIDDCVSTDGFTPPPGWSLETSNMSAPHVISVAPGSGTGVQVQCQLTRGTGWLRAVRTVATTMPAGEPYLTVDIKATSSSTNTASWSGPILADFDGVTYEPIGVSYGEGEAGSSRYYFKPPTSFTTAKFYMDYKDSFSATTAQTFATTVYKLQATDTVGDVTTSTTRQQARLTTVYGAMPTRATIRLSDETPAALGTDILIYTSSNTAWPPPLRPWLTSSSPPTADTTMVSGGRQTLAADSVFRIPARLLEDGAYCLVGRIKCTVAAALTWKARMVATDGSDTLGSDQIQTGQVTISVTSGYDLLDLADGLILPTFEVETDDYDVELTLTGTSNMTLDEAWLLGLDNGAITRLEDSGDPVTGLQWIEIRSPDLGAARPSVFGGIGAVGDLSACVDAKTRAFGPHRFEPGPLLVFTMCTSSLVAQCELEYFPRFHSHPAANQSDPDTSGA
jgi:hypothetical protein